MNSDMYTGSNSGSFNNYRATKLKKELAEDKERKKAQLTPAYQIVHELVEKEIANVQSIEYLLVDIQTPDEMLKAELVARRRYIAYLKAFESVLKKTLREKK